MRGCNVFPLGTLLFRSPTYCRKDVENESYSQRSPLSFDSSSRHREDIARSEPTVSFKVAISLIPDLAMIWVFILLMFIIC